MKKACLVLLAAWALVAAGGCSSPERITVRTPYGVYEDVEAQWWWEQGWCEFEYTKPDAKKPTRVLTNTFQIEIDTK